MNNIDQYRVQVPTYSDTGDYLKPNAPQLEPALDTLLTLLAEYALAKA